MTTRAREAITAHGTAHTRLTRFVGHTPFERALRMHLQRLGRGVTSIRLPEEGGWERAIAKSIERHEKEVEKLSRKPKPSKRLAKIVARVEMLKKMRGLGFRPRATDLAAALAYEHGLEGSRLHPLLTALNTANINANRMLYSGSLCPVLNATSRNLLSRVNQALHSTPTALNSREIAQRIGIEATPKNFNRITAALGVLDLMSITYKLPTDIERPGSFKWAHACYKNHPTTIPHWNLDYRVLVELRTGPKKPGELGLVGEADYGTKRGEQEDNIATRPAIVNSFLRLKQAGLVQIKEKGFGMSAQLTECGARLLNEQDHRTGIHPELRQLLLGLPREEGELGPRAQRLVKRILHWARIVAEVEKFRQSTNQTGPYGGIKPAARALNIRPSRAYEAAYGSVPWRGVTLQSLREVYLPHVRENDPEMARIFEQRIREEEEKERQNHQASK